MNRIALGIYDGPSGGAALLHDGQLIALAEEDRLRRIHRVSGLPRAAVQSVLRASGIPAQEISVVIVATENSPYLEFSGDFPRTPLLNRVGESMPFTGVSRRILKSLAIARRRRVDEGMRSEFGVSCPVRFVDHHLAHALVAAYGLPKPDCLAITMDGGADGAWAKVTVFDGGKPHVLAVEPGPVSLLDILWFLTGRLGIQRGPGRFQRFQRLAAHGEPHHAAQLSPSIEVRDGVFRIDPHILQTRGAAERVLASARREDVAASALEVVGNVVGSYVDYWGRRNSEREIVLGGDLFGISALVDATRRRDHPAQPCVPSTVGDSSLMIGAALATGIPGLLPEPFEIHTTPFATPFLGTAFTDEDIRTALELEHFESAHHADIEVEIAAALAHGKSVARFDGKTEIGARGLGNRVVLRHPGLPLRHGRLGFALHENAYHALVTAEAVEQLFIGGDPSTMARGFLPALLTPQQIFIDHCPELISWGGKVDVQAVSRSVNPRLHRILQEFEKHTQFPCLAVAPFRTVDEPLVCTPRDALVTFRILGADLAAIGRYLVQAQDHLTATNLDDPEVAEETTTPAAT